MIYSPSNQLAEILISNGFNDITEIIFPEHFQRLKKNGYTPENIKRVFSYGNSCSLKFNYLNIEPSYNGTTYHAEILQTITQDELKSIITFCKLPSQTRSAYRRKRQNIPELYKEYYSIKKHPELYKDKGSDYIVKIFESILV